jgi:hypothetical protein
MRYINVIYYKVLLKKRKYNFDILNIEIYLRGNYLKCWSEMKKLFYINKKL